MSQFDARTEAAKLTSKSDKVFEYAYSDSPIEYQQAYKALVQELHNDWKVPGRMNEIGKKFEDDTNEKKRNEINHQRDLQREKEMEAFYRRSVIAPAALPPGPAEMQISDSSPTPSIQVDKNGDVVQVCFTKNKRFICVDK